MDGLSEREKLKYVNNKMGISNKDIIEEEEMEKRVRAEKQMRDRHQNFRSKRKERLKKEVKVEEFIIKPIDYLSKLNIEHPNEICQYSEAKKFKNSNLITETSISENVQKFQSYSDNILQECYKMNEYNIIPNINEYIINKGKTYIIDNSNREQIIQNKKMKYNELELINSNEINIHLEIDKKKVYEDDQVENGIPINDLKIDKKRRFENLSDSEKVKVIIEEIKKESIIEKIIKEKKVSMNYYFCINCFQCFSRDEINNHDGHFFIDINDFKDSEDDIDYNEGLNKLYKILKKEQNKFLKSRNNNLIKYYRKLLSNLYEIIINNNSYEDLNTSIINIYEEYIKEDKLGTFFDYYKDYFLLFYQQICKLAFLKVQEMSLSELGDETDNSFKDLDEEDLDFEDNLKDDINDMNNTDEDKKKYFFKIGLKLKNKSDKYISLSELYSKAKEEYIEPNNYENFIIKELNIQ